MAYQPKSNRNKFLAGTVTAALVASAVTPAFAAETTQFADQDQFGSHKDNILKAAELGLIKGTTTDKGTFFNPNKELSRSDVVKILGRYVGNVDVTGVEQFKDVAATSKAGDELYDSALKLKKKGIFTGTNGDLLYLNDITRQQMAKVLVNAFDLKHVAGATSKVTDLDKAQAEYQDYIKILSENGVTTVSTYDPTGKVSRAQFATFLVNAINATSAASVTGVSAINYTTVELSGTGLSKLTKNQVAIKDNTVKSVEFDATTGKAKVTFNKPFVSGVEQTLDFTDSKDEKTSFKFTYTLDVKSVEATTSRIDDDTAGQFLGFTINGGVAVSAQYLKDSGYDVEFQATNASYLADSTTGEIDETKSLSNFAYKVVISKGDSTFESELKSVEVLDFATYLTKINEVTVDQGDVSVKSGKISVQDGTVNVVATKATSISGATITSPTVTYKSSNPAVASVNATTGEVTPIKSGAVTITISADGATYEVPLTVVSGARTATTVTATNSSVKLLAGNTKDVDYTVVDQYGDEYEGDLSVVSANDTIATSTGTLTFVDGKATGTISAVAKGNTSISLKNGTKTLKTVSVSVSDDSTLSSRKVETVSASSDLTLDVVNSSKNKKVDLVWNKYNAGGYLIGAEDDYTNVAGTKYTVSSSDDSVATVDVAADGTITVTGVSAGTANVVIKEGTVTRATAKITVKDTTPTITAVNFESVEDVKTAAALNTPVLKAEGIKLSSTDYTPEIDTTGTIFADVDDVPGLSAGDIILGTLSAVYSGPAANITALGVTGGSVTATTVAAGAQGTIVAKVTLAGKQEAFATTTINVKVPQ